MEMQDDAMRLGSKRYADVLEGLQVAGLAAEFTQTGGMNAALEIALEGGYHLLVTEADDSLAWHRDDHSGWGVGLYRPDSEYDDGPLRYESVEDPSVEALVSLVRTVLS